MWGLALLALLGCSRQEPFDNVVLVTIDTLRADHLGSYGYPLPTSPFLDSLAADGVRFDRAIAASSHTAPSHASMFTSHYPARHRVLFNGLDLGQGIPTLASLLGEAGFESTAVISVRFLNGVTPGFDQVLRPERGQGGPRVARGTVDAALGWLETREQGKRFFLWLHLYDVHAWRDGRGDPELDQLARVREAVERDPDRMLEFWRTEHGIPEEGMEPPEFLVYDAQIATADANIERLFDAVREREPEARTLWVITSDHGEGLGNHGFAGHGKYLYQEQVRVPLILYGGRGWYRGRIVPDMVRHVDLLPTVAELVGLEVDSRKLGVEGVSFVPLLSGTERADTPRFAYSQRRPADETGIERGWSDGLVIAAQTTRYKYILNTDGEDEFYDLESDPLELRNLVARETPERERMASWLARKYESMLQEPLNVEGDEEIDEEHLDELKALGYLQ